MPVVDPLRTRKNAFDALANLYEKKAPTPRRALKKQLHSLKMEKDETIATFFSKISQIRDQLMAIGDKVEYDDLVQTVFDGLPASWETFLASVNGREFQPNFKSLWHDCLGEEGRIQSRSGPPSENYHALIAKEKKGKNLPQHKDNGKEPQGK